MSVANSMLLYGLSFTGSTGFDSNSGSCSCFGTQMVRRRLAIKSPDLASSYQDRGVSSGGFKLSIRSSLVRLVRELAYPWPVAPQQCRFPFQLIFFGSQDNV